MDPVSKTPQAGQNLAEHAQPVNRLPVALNDLQTVKIPKEVRKLVELLNFKRPPKQLEAAVKEVSAPSATTSAAGGRFETVDDRKAVVGEITVDGQRLNTLLAERSFNETRWDQNQYAKKLGYRMATRREHEAYVKDLLAKEGNNTINDAEKYALQTYRLRYVHDAQGGLDVDGWRVRDLNRWHDYDYPCVGALFVRASAASK